MLCRLIEPKVRVRVRELKWMRSPCSQSITLSQMCLWKYSRRSLIWFSKSTRASQQTNKINSTDSYYHCWQSTVNSWLLHWNYNDPGDSLVFAVPFHEVCQLMLLSIRNLSHDSSTFFLGLILCDSEDCHKYSEWENIQHCHQHCKFVNFEYKVAITSSPFFGKELPAYQDSDYINCQQEIQVLEELCKFI